jgi:FG-GAP repeat
VDWHASAVLGRPLLPQGQGDDRAPGDRAEGLGVRRRLVIVLLLLVGLVAGSDAGSNALPRQAGAADVLRQANIRIDGPAAGDSAGVSVAAAGDVNGDGLGDVLVGAGAADNNGRERSGSAYVVFGQASPTSVDLAALGTHGFRIDGRRSGRRLGRSRRRRQR